MADFIHEDLSGSRFEHVDLTGSRFERADLGGAEFRSIDFVDTPVRECLSTILNEEWEHRLYGERDLDALGAPKA